MQTESPTFDCVICGATIQRKNKETHRNWHSYISGLQKTIREHINEESE